MNTGLVEDSSCDSASTSSGYMSGDLVCACLPNQYRARESDLVLLKSAYNKSSVPTREWPRFFASAVAAF